MAGAPVTAGRCHEPLALGRHGEGRCRSPARRTGPPEVWVSSHGGRARGAPTHQVPAVTALLPLVVPVVGSIAVLLTARRRPVAATLGCLALAGTLLAALAVAPGEVVRVDAGTLAPTEYGRLVLVLMSAAGLLLGGAAAAAGERPGGLAAMLVALPGAWIALTAPDPVTATWAILASSVAALLAARLVDGADGRWEILAGTLRAIVVAGSVMVAGVAVGTPTAEGPAPDPTVAGLAFGAVAATLVLRIAAVPLHRWAARLADQVPLAAVVALVAWLPAVAVGVVLAWSDLAVTPVALDLGLERGMLVVVALTTLPLAALAATTADDVGHIVTYLAIAAGGVALLGVAAIDPTAWAPTRTWLAISAVTVSGLATWAVVLERAYGTRRLGDLPGWARRSPVLAATIVALGAATVGLPGWTAFEARSAIVDAAVDGPLALLARILLVAPLVPLARLLVVGLAPVSPSVHDGRSERPRVPEHLASRTVAPASDRVRAAWLDARALWRLDRMPAASAVVLVAALLAVGVAAGATSLATAAGGPPPGFSVPLEPSLEDPTGQEGQAPDASPLPGDPASPGGSPLPDESSTGQDPPSGSGATPSP